MSSQINKIYKYLPKKIETIDSLCRINKSWVKDDIVKRTGIFKKRIQSIGGIKNLILGLKKKQ